MIKKILLFSREVIIKLYKNDLYTQANAMTFRMILAIFPLIIVMIASLSFFHFDIESYLSVFKATLNEEVKSLLNSVIADVFNTKHISLLSTSAVVAVYSSSLGFLSMIMGMNKAFNKQPEKGPIAIRVLSIILVFVFILIIFLSLCMLIFGDVIVSVLKYFNLNNYIPKSMQSLFMLSIGIVIGIIFLIIVHKTAVDKKIPVKNILPGAFFTVSVWLIASKIFNFYVNNFYRYSILYGSIGTFFVFVLWLNILCYVILIGSQITAVLCDKEFMDSLKNIN